jgi:glycerophosphoryl diester phosphodiesterase
MIKTKVWAHRGASAYAPENSLEAFELAIKMGAHGIELDIYETADAKLVIHHDNDIRRMTNGVEAKIQETDFDTLRSYHFNGEWGDQ